MVVTSGAQRVPAAQRVILDSKVSGEQKSKIREAAAARFGGFAVGQWGRSGVLGATLVSVNGENGKNDKNGYFDSRGIYNLTSTGAFAVSSAPGTLKLVAKPGHYQIPKHFDNHFEFRAKSGHYYFVGYIVDEANRQLRWIPVVYDKTEESVVPLPDIQPQSSPKPSTVTIYI